MSMPIGSMYITYTHTLVDGKEKKINLIGKSQTNVQNQESYQLVSFGLSGQPQRRPDDRTSNAGDAVLYEQQVRGAGRPQML